jgi:transcription elongation factor Elf1
MAKEFNKKFMHPTRRKLVDMVMSGGEYQKDTFVSFNQTQKDIKREVGDVWEDSDGNIWEQRDFGKVKKSKLTDTMSEVRQYLQQISTCKDDNCDVVGKYSRADKKLISKTGYCAGCLSKRELQIKLDGLWKEYEVYKLATNMLEEGKEVLAKLQQAYNDANQEYEYVNEDGTLEKWAMERDVEELKAEILVDVTETKEKLERIEEERNIAWDKLKNKNYDLVKPLIG